MNNRQRQILVAFLASMVLGLLGGLAFKITTQLIRPGKIDPGPASPEGPGRAPALHEQNTGASDPSYVVPREGGPPVTTNFQPC